MAQKIADNSNREEENSVEEAQKYHYSDKKGNSIAEGSTEETSKFLQQETNCLEEGSQKCSLLLK